MPHGTPYSDSSDRDAEKQARCIYFYVALASRSVVTDYIHANVPGEWPSYFNACFLNYAHKILQQKVSGQKDLCDEDLKVIKILEAAFPTTEATEYIRALEIFRTTRWLRTQGAKGSEFVGGVISLEKVWGMLLCSVFVSQHGKLTRRQISKPC